MKRRDFMALLGSAATWPLAARAQQAAMPVIGFLSSGSPDIYSDRLRTFQQGLKEAGYVEDQNVAIEYRWDEGQTDRLPLLVQDLLRRQVALIVSFSTPAALAAKPATTTVPVVFVSGGDPVKLGLVASLNRPGGNITGISFIQAELGAKRLGLLRELRPAATRIAVLADTKWPTIERFVSDVRAAASASGRQIEVLYVGSDREIETAFTTLVQRGAGALVSGTGRFFLSQRERIVALAARHKIPAIYGQRDYVEAGGLMSYGPSIPDTYRQLGIYAGRVLKGEKPGDLPVMLPTKFELVINVKTAKALGLEIPEKLLALADQVVE